ncbi:hypothetical protein [Paraflavitalea speifideaquila]|uniref:hypothetical protein n=1 Tax=Paraflavitalea speifideaquila TaxID=3076558 RepID=UPI0028EF2F38|nr:hypothetical protein [Paraflavitalea speifideiaquila]
MAGVQSKYQLPSGNLEITNKQYGSSNSQAYSFYTGLQADFTFGKISLSPSVSAGYFHSTRDTFTQSSQVMVNGGSRMVILAGSPRQKARV